MDKQYSYEEYSEIASDEVLEKLHYEYMRYGDDDDTIETFYLGNVKYWDSLLK